MPGARTAPGSVAEVIDRIAGIQPVLRAGSEAGDRLRRLPDESVEALLDVGAFRLGTPRRYGGLEGTTRDMLDVAAATAYADGSAGWVVALANVCGWLAGLMPRRLQDEIWGEDPDALVTGVIAPTSQAVRVDGGYRVTGRWSYNSGSHHASWMGVGIPIPNEAGGIVDHGLGFLPRADCAIEDTWFTTGMRATASNAIVVEDAFVPDHRVMMVPSAIAGRYLNEHLDDEPTHRAAFVPVLALVLIGAQLGLGRAAYDHVVDKASEKAIAYSYFATQAESTAVQLEIAKIAQLLDTAQLHAHRAASDIDRAAAIAEYPDHLTRARVRADTALVAEKVLEAIDRLMSIHGAGSFAEANPLQRIWRDANTAARHGVVNPLIAYEVYGKAIFGDERPVVSPLV
jgi:alkylation response protein AidB-like acyl-CoA dehydrogenase